MSEHSQPFTDMADRVLLNAEQGFGGAFVIVPPGDDAKPRVMLLLDNANNQAIFWATLQSVASIALDEIRRDEESAAGAFGPMRR